MKIRLHLGSRARRSFRASISDRLGLPWAILNQPRRLISAGVVLLSGLILIGAIIGQHGYLALRKQQEELKQAEQERDRARAEQLRLKKELDELRSPQGIERVAREEIKLAKPGEIVVTLPDSKGTATSPHQNSKGRDPSSNPQGAPSKEPPQ